MGRRYLHGVALGTETQVTETFTPPTVYAESDVLAFIAIAVLIGLAFGMFLATAFFLAASE